MHEVPVRMPKMSMTMTEGEVVAWSITPGTEVRAGQTVCEVLTDKVDMEVESPVSGRLVRIEIDAGLAQVGDPIAWIETEEQDALAGLFDEPEPGGAPAHVVAAAGAPAAAQDTATTDTTDTADSAPAGAAAPAAPRVGPVPAVPRARALARSNGVDLADLAGSGPDGRVLVADVEQHLRATAATTAAVAAPPEGAAATPPPATAAAAAAPAAAATPTPTPAAAAPAVPAQPVAPPAPAGTAPARQRRAEAMRAAVARSMSASASVPQFTVWRDLDVAAADAARGRVSWTTLLLRGYAAALRELPVLLGRWDGSRVVPGEQVNVALAVDTGAGLLVPVFADPDRVGVEALDDDVRSTVASAQAGRIAADHLLPAAGTLSNLGGLAVDRFQALVTPPQASVLACGAIDRRPVAVPGGVGLGLRLTVGLSVDHRVADGADGARLLAALATAVGDPLRVLGPVVSRAGVSAA